MSIFPHELTLSSPEETGVLAKQIGTLLRAGDILLFEGDIGAGKTHFARCLIQSLLTVPEDVPSPTFTLVQTYDTPEFEIWHADLYRLTSPDEIIELGLTEAFETAVCLVEWPDRLAELRPKHALTVSLRMTEIPGQRILTFLAESPRWSQVLEKIINA